MISEFKDWLITENYRISQEYRMLLWKEFFATKNHYGVIDEIVKPVLIQALRKIEIPPYQKYEGNLDRETQLEIYRKLKKPDKADLLANFIIDNF